jgi:predicted O-methyltransferase YrrM
MKCPNCQSTKTRKHGFYRGKQRYQCKDCARQFVENQSPYLQQQSSTGVEDRIQAYIRSISTPPLDLLLDLQRDIAELPLAQMQPSIAQAQQIALLVRSIGASRILEIGIFSGYTTLAMAVGLPSHGQIVSCGVTGAHVDVARGYWARSGLTAQIDFQICSGLELLDRLSASRSSEFFDAIVICGLKHQYLDYYRQAIDLLRPQGLLLTTDVLWQGRVLNPDAYQDEFTRGIDLFNRELAADDRVSVTILPIGDGLSIAMKL